MIKEKIEKFKIKEISKFTGIPESTLYRYTREEGIEQHIRFLKLLKYLDITIDEILEDNSRLK